MKHIRCGLFVICLLAGLLWQAVAAENSQDTAYLLNIKGGIGPATQDYVRRGLDKAAQQQAKLVILQIDTPGGLDKSMRGIIHDMLASPLPIVGFVGPSGSRAASAGTYILYASNIAAMAPGTNLGAASPVSIGGLTPMDDDKESKEKSQKSTMEKKVSEDAAAYIRSLAQLRGRNVEWAEKAVLQAKSLSAEEALKEQVIDLIANDIPDLLTKVNGRIVKINSSELTLQTEGLTVITVEPDWRSRFLAVITDPSIAYILLLVGIYGLFFEFANPGMVIPGVAGVIALLIALYAFQLLPINYAGLGLIFLGIVFMVMEAFVPSFGALGVGGIIAFIVGSVLLMDTDVEGYTIAWPIILSIAGVTAAFILLIVNMALRARFRPVVSGREEILGSVAQVIAVDNGIRIRIRGEIWQARAKTEVQVGQSVRVIGRTGLILDVEPIQGEIS